MGVITYGHTSWSQLPTSGPVPSTGQADYDGSLLPGWESVAIPQDWDARTIVTCRALWPVGVFEAPAASFELLLSDDGLRFWPASKRCLSPSPASQTTEAGFSWQLIEFQDRRFNGIGSYMLQQATDVNNNSGPDTLYPIPTKQWASSSFNWVSFTVYVRVPSATTAWPQVGVYANGISF
jgi:hypothetical protein